MVGPRRRVDAATGVHQSRQYASSASRSTTARPSSCCHRSIRCTAYSDAYMSLATLSGSRTASSSPNVSLSCERPTTRFRSSLNQAPSTAMPISATSRAARTGPWSSSTSRHLRGACASGTHRCLPPHTLRSGEWTTTRTAVRRRLRLGSSHLEQVPDAAYGRSAVALGEPGPPLERGQSPSRRSEESASDNRLQLRSASRSTAPAGRPAPSGGRAPSGPGPTQRDLRTLSLDFVGVTQVSLPLTSPENHVPGRVKNGVLRASLAFEC